MNFDVHFLEPLEPEAADLFSRQVDRSVRISSGLIDPQSASFHLLVAGVPEREHLEVSRQLRALVVPWAGLSAKVRELMHDFPDIEVYNIHHNASPTAESAIMLMLTAARDTLAIDRQFRSSDWRPRYDSDRPLLMCGRTALIVGYGAVGRHVAQGCAGLGMKVNAVRADVSVATDSGISLYAPDQLDALLPTTDVLFLCLPLTPQTKSLIGAAQLAALPDNAIVVNVSRGRIVDEEALYNELRSGRIRAGLDVWYKYPRDEASRVGQEPSNYPFANLTNVVMTPHLAGHCAQIELLRAEALVELINALVRGEVASGRVDVHRGY